jgi:hypothetical protein
LRQDEQDGIPNEIALTKWCMGHSGAILFFHPVNPVHPVKFLPNYNVHGAILPEPAKPQKPTVGF